MKNLKKLACITISIFALSCSKKDDSPTAPVYKEENFYEGFLINSGYIELTVNYINSSLNYEGGFEFSPMVKGKITSLVVKIPDIKNNLKITLWDQVTKTVLRTETVNVASANTQYVFDIIDIDLIKDKEYCISMNTDDYYVRSRQDNTNATYPIIVGNIKVNRCKTLRITSQTYPEITLLKSCLGDLSFNFLRTE